MFANTVYKTSDDFMAAVQTKGVIVDATMVLVTSRVIARPFIIRSKSMVWQQAKRRDKDEIFLVCVGPGKFMDCYVGTYYCFTNG